MRFKEWVPPAPRSYTYIHGYHTRFGVRAVRGENVYGNVRQWVSLLYDRGTRCMWKNKDVPSSTQSQQRDIREPKEAAAARRHLRTS